MATTPYFPETIPKPRHSFQVGFKVEAVHPQLPNFMAPATIVSVNLPNDTFVVEIDDCTNLTPGSGSPPAVTFVSHAGDARIQPPGMAHLRAIPLLLPRGWDKISPNQAFHWVEYAAYCEERIAASQFPERLCYLPSAKYFKWTEYRRSCTEEGKTCVNVGAIVRVIPPQLTTITTTTSSSSSSSVTVSPSRADGNFMEALVVRAIGSLLWINFASFRPNESFMYDGFSSWIQCNGGRSAAVLPISKTTPIHLPLPSSGIKTFNLQTSTTNSTPGSRAHIQLFIYSHRCFHGQKISESHLRNLPKCVGPGPPEQVFHHLLQLMARSFTVKSSIFAALSRWHSCIKLATRAQTSDWVQSPICWFVKGPPQKLWVYSILLPATVEAAKTFCKRLCILLQLCPGFITVLTEDMPEPSLMCPHLCEHRRLAHTYADERRFSIRQKGSLIYPLQVIGHGYDHMLDSSSASVTSTGSTSAAPSPVSPKKIVTRNRISEVIMTTSASSGVEDRKLKRRSAEVGTNNSSNSTLTAAAAAPPSKRLRRKLPNAVNPDDNVNNDNNAKSVQSNHHNTTSNHGKMVDSRRREYNPLQHMFDQSYPIVRTSTHPKTWSTDMLVEFLAWHSAPSPICDWARREQLDGTSFMLLNRPLLQGFGMKEPYVEHLNKLIIGLRKAVLVS